MFISGGLAHFPIICTTDEYMDSFTRVLLTFPGEWKKSYLDDDGQWYYYDNGMRISSSISATSSSQDIDLLEPIILSSQNKAPNVTFPDDLDFIKGATDEKFLYEVPDIDMPEFENYNR